MPLLRWAVEHEAAPRQREVRLMPQGDGWWLADVPEGTIAGKGLQPVYVEDGHLWFIGYEIPTKAADYKLVRRLTW